MMDIECRKFLQKWHKEIFEIADKTTESSFMEMLEQHKIILNNIILAFNEDEEITY